MQEVVAKEALVWLFSQFISGFCSPSKLISLRLLIKIMQHSHPHVILATVRRLFETNAANSESAQQDNNNNILRLATFINSYVYCVFSFHWFCW